MLAATVSFPTEILSPGGGAMLAPQDPDTLAHDDVSRNRQGQIRLILRKRDFRGGSSKG